jgi:hypothetical protein
MTCEWNPKVNPPKSHGSGQVDDGEVIGAVGALYSIVYWVYMYINPAPIHGGTHWEASDFFPLLILWGIGWIGVLLVGCILAAIIRQFQR